MKVPRSGRSKRNAGSRCFSVEVNEGCRCREQWHGAGELWRPGLTFASVLFTLSLAWVAVLWSFKSTTDSRQSPSDSPGFLAVEEGSTSSSGDVTSTESIGHAPVIPPVMVDQAELGMLPKAVWHPRMRQAPSAAPTARAAAPTARAAAPTARSAAQAAALAAPGAVRNSSMPAKSCQGDLRSLTAELAKKVHGPQEQRALDLAVSAWKRLLDGQIQVEYMRQRLCDRMKAWLTALMEMTWTRPVVGHKEISRALVWPRAAYLHFGVRRVWSLGEYTQWADLCGALATLGLEVTLWPHRRKQFPVASTYDSNQVVYTDYDGVHAGKSKQMLPPPDKTWLLDTFGTDGTVVQNDFFGRISPLTDYPLHRFLTLVPGYSSRNTFLGVAAVARKVERRERPPRKWQCVLWSKVHPWLAESNGFPAYHWKLLREYTKHCKVIATVDKKDTYKTADLIKDCCPEVEIREVQSPQAFRDLLQISAVYVGLGEPLIAPSCFEALSLGTHVVQPRFPEPRKLKNKPITQNWTSQHPFLEQVPEPYAFTIDPLNFEAVADTFRTLRQTFDSIHSQAQSRSADQALHEFYMSGEYPGREEFSIGGFLKRVAGTVTKTRTLEAADWDWERQDHPRQLPSRAFKK